MAGKREIASFKKKDMFWGQFLRSSLCELDLVGHTYNLGPGRLASWRSASATWQNPVSKQTNKTTKPPPKTKPFKKAFKRFSISYKNIKESSNIPYSPTQAQCHQGIC